MTTDRATCGYLQESGGPCREPQEGKRCTRHNNPRFSLCDGCGQDAVGECAAFNTAELSSGHPCRKPVCENCGHRADDTHGVDDSPFAAQRPRSGQAGVVRAALIESVEKILDHAVTTGWLRFRDDPEGIGVRTAGDYHDTPYRDRVASLLVDEVTADAFGRMLAGIALGQAAG